MPESPPALCNCPKCDKPWQTMTDALKCCNPRWKRVQLCRKNPTGFGITYGDFDWIEVEEPKPGPKRKPR